MKLFENIVSLEESKVKEYQKKAFEIKSAIEDKMKSYENFEKISLSSGKDNEKVILYIYSTNKEIQGYFFGDTVKIDIEENSLEEVLEKFEKNWLKSDNPENIKEKKSFIDSGNRFGWD